ncbi:hypothetical protein SAMN04488101_104145 [Pedobacter nyackensis]|uniref:Uncharacterized protein n=1 Tax=Pedobacter nyackensis TaxID=475255 RepID=A0A1W2CPV4_9SPHI|nr:hypothetical protein SAMN04488101_104145 [Pedobacter nyackensis]
MLFTNEQDSVGLSSSLNINIIFKYKSEDKISFDKTDKCKISL